MFWRFTPLLSQLDKLLDNQDVKLSEVLGEDDVILECKSHNQKLIDLIIVPENLLTLVKYVVSEPPEDVADEVKFRLANIAGELLSADICEVNDALVENDDYLNYFYNFFLNEAPLNPLLASFVVKILNVLIQRKGEKVVEYFQGKNDFIDRIILHIGTSAIMDFLLKFLQFSEPPSVKLQVLDWCVKSRLVPRLVEQLESDDDEKHFNACQCLTNLLHACRDQFSQSSSQSDMLQLHDSIESEETISDLLERILSGEIRDSKVINGLSFIEALFEQRKFDSPLDSLVPPSQSELDRLESTTQTVIRCIVPKLSIFKSILESPPKQFYQTMPTSCGILSPPLGNTRLQVVYLIQSLFILDRHELNMALCAQNVLAVIQNLFFQYHWNTFLHKSVENLFIHIISVVLPPSCDNSAESVSPDQNEEFKQRVSLLRQLLIDNQFVQKLLDVWKENKEEESMPGGRRRGYMGHLSSLANHLQEDIFSMEESTVWTSELTKDLGDQLIVDWRTFFNDEIIPLNNKNKIDHESFSRSESSSEEEDTDYKFPTSLTLHLQQNYLEYQNQPITNAFPDTFGYNEDEFTENVEKDKFYRDMISSLDFSVATPEDTRNATMFEQACNEEIRQFDDFDEESEVDMTELGVNVEEEVDEEDDYLDFKLNDRHASFNTSHSIDELEKLSLDGILSSDLNDEDDIDLKNPLAFRTSRSPDRRPTSGARKLVSLTKLKFNRSREFIPKSEIETSRKLETPDFNLSMSRKTPLNLRFNSDTIGDDIDIEDEDDDDDDDDDDEFYSTKNVRDAYKLALSLEDSDDAEDNCDQSDAPPHSLRTPRLKSVQNMEIDVDEQTSPNDNNNSNDSNPILDSPPLIDETDDVILSVSDSTTKDNDGGSQGQSNNNFTCDEDIKIQVPPNSSSRPESTKHSPTLKFVEDTESYNDLQLLASELKEEKLHRNNYASSTTTGSKRPNIIIVRMNGTEYVKPLSYSSTEVSSTNNTSEKPDLVPSQLPDGDDDKWDHIAEEARQLREQLDSINLEDITLTDETVEENQVPSPSVNIPMLSDKRERYKEKEDRPVKNGPTYQEETTKLPENSQASSDHLISKNIAQTTPDDARNVATSSQTNGSN